MQPIGPWSQNIYCNILYPALQGDFGKILSALGIPLWLLPVVEEHCLSYSDFATLEARDSPSIGLVAMRSTEPHARNR